VRAHHHISMDSVTQVYGDRTVFVDLSLVASSGDRLGLIGENGAGKSTLLRLAAGVEEPSDGAVRRPTRTGLLWQELETRPGDTIDHVLERGLAEVRAIERRVEEAGVGLATDHPAAADNYAIALDDAERAGLWTIEQRRDETLRGLGLGHLALDRPVDALSGGQRSRLGLAALLLSRPDALLLDEPTNHLDDEAVAFLRDRLIAWEGPVLFASHDRAFLDEVATGLIDIDPSRGGPRRFGGNYTAYLAEKAAERLRWEAQFVAEAKEERALAATMEETARRGIAPGRGPRDNEKMGYDKKTGTVQRQVARRIRNAGTRLETLRDTRVDAPAPVLDFAGIPSGSHLLEEGDVLTTDGATVAGRLAPLDLGLAHDASLLITGRNGAGKSTLLALLAGRLAPTSGRVHRRKGLRVGLLEQDVRFAEPARSPRSLYERAVGERRAETTPLAGLGLIADRDLDRPVGSLSIGQQRRMALALIIARPPHVFLLDEPTNHLSLALATELEEALGGYPGAVVVASHDRWLRRRWEGAHLRLAPA